LLPQGEIPGVDGKRYNQRGTENFEICSLFPVEATVRRLPAGSGRTMLYADGCRSEPARPSGYDPTRRDEQDDRGGGCGAWRG
jgi:hypothetical protein